MGFNIIGKVIIVVNKGNVVIGNGGTINPTDQQNDMQGAGSSVSSEQVRDVLNDVREEIGSIELPTVTKKRKIK